jgi:glycosyltransferase involved in cell wall biosynthesis
MLTRIRDKFSENQERRRQRREEKNAERQRVREERERARQQAQELGIGQKVKFLGKTTDVERLLCISDLFLLPSEKESFGLAALEAMGAGVPVISSNTGGLPEVNIHNQTGFTANVGDVDIMSGYAIDLLKDPVKHLEFCQAARKQAERFSIEEIGPHYEDCYHRAIASSHA